MRIHLVGPGGAGKSTVGAALADRIEFPFLDLDSEFMSRVGDISEVIDRDGYRTYARMNVETYLAIADAGGPSVIAMSSGFMTYAEDIHPLYLGIHSKISSSPTTFVLLPSLELESCVRETVRRQLTRPFVHSAPKEESVIRERYGIYMAIQATKIETGGSADQAVEHILATLPPNTALQPSSLHSAAERPFRYTPPGC